MARPIKAGVDYFPHDVDTDGKTLFTLEATFGNDGYAFWFKLLELLGKQEDLFYDCNDEANMLYLCARAKVDVVSGAEILDLLAKLGAIDQKLWENRIIWCQNFVNRLADVYDKRKVKLPEKPSFRDGNPNNEGVIGAETTADDENAGVFGAESTQSKVNKSKVNKSKSKESKAAAPPALPQKHKFGAYGWVKLTDEEHQRLIHDLGEAETERCIAYVDESAQRTGNKNKWRDWNLVLRKCSRERWGMNNAPPKPVLTPEQQSRRDQYAEIYEKY